MFSVKKIQDKQVKIAVMGLGYVGLPLAVEFARQGFSVLGFDQDQSKVDAINTKKNYIDDVDDSHLFHAVEVGLLTASTDPKSLRDVDIVIICVPTPLNKTWEPDMSFVISAADCIAAHVKQSCLVILESTTYPGTTEEVLLPILEEKGLVLGKDFGLVFSPERVDPGNPQFKTHNIPKIVGGINSESMALGEALYAHIVDRVVPVSSPKVAETAKLLENTFRTVNIGLINETALMCHEMDIDVWEVIDAAATKPFGFMPFYPGPGLGGHCLPIDPMYLAWKAKSHNFDTRFIHLAAEVNRSMPHFVVDRVVDVLNDQSLAVRGSRILVLGVAYKNDVDDVRESPAVDIMESLIDKGADIHYSDPHIAQLTVREHSFTSEDFSAKNLKKADCVLIVTAHNAFDYELVVENATVIVDTRNATKNVAGAKDNVVKL